MTAQSISQFAVRMASEASEVLPLTSRPGASSAADRTTQHNAFGVNDALNSTTTPLPTRVLSITLTIAAGVAQIDLSAAVMSDEAAEDLTGKKIFYAEFKAPSGNTATIVLNPAATPNDMDIFGADDLDIPKGAKAAIYFGSDNGPAVGATDKIIKFTGTNGDTIDVRLGFTG